MDDFERRLCTQTQLLYINKTFNMSQMNPKFFFYNTAYSVQPPYIAVTPFKGILDVNLSYPPFIE